MNNKIIVLCGKSACGKDTLANYFKEKGYNFITSHTTRPLRENESQGNPYYFITNSEMEELIDTDQLIEYRVYKTLVDDIPANWYYAVHKDEVQDDKKYIVVLDLHGLKEFKKYFGDRVTSFYLDVPDSIRTERAKNRGSFNETEWNRRLKADDLDFELSKVYNSVDIILLNCDFYTVEELYDHILKYNLNKVKKLYNEINDILKEE